MLALYTNRKKVLAQVPISESCFEATQTLIWCISQGVG